MNTEHDDKQLDDLLQQWATDSTSAERLADLNDQIVASLAVPTKPSAFTTRQDEQVLPSLSRSVAQQLPANQSRWASGFALGVVVTTLLSVSFLLLQGDRAVVLPVDEGPPEYAWLQNDQLHNKAVLLSEMEKMFDRQLVWLAETDDRMTFALSDPSNTTEGSSDRNRLAVRVVVERRAAGSGEWQPAWTMDVVSRSEEMISLSSQELEGHQLRLWTYCLPDGMIAVDSEFQLQGAESLLSEASQLHPDDTPVKVLTSRNNGTEFRVFQSVAVLDRKVI